jgi:hypothetical protein
MEKRIIEILYSKTIEYYDGKDLIEVPYMDYIEEYGFNNELYDNLSKHNNMNRDDITSLFYKWFNEKDEYCTRWETKHIKRLARKFKLKKITNNLAV